MRCLLGLFPIIVAAGCGSSSSPNSSADGPPNGGDGPPNGGDGQVGDAKTIDAPPVGSKRKIFVIPMENKPSTAIYGNTTDAPYINSLMAQAAHTTMFRDELPADPSEPHYVLMEAGTAAFTDYTFTTDNSPSASNSTSSTAHLVNTLDAVGATWMSYQEGITSGTCPINNSGNYGVRHNPFVFFQDVAGNPPKTTTPRCVQHHKPYSAFAGDLAADTIPDYNFITPDVCHDMHGATNCPQGTSVAANIRAGDTWLMNELPRILTYANAHDAVVFITWDEGNNTNLIPFLALGPSVKPNSTSTMTYNHGSIVKSVQEMYGAAILSKVANTNDFADLFLPGHFP